jgi:hypothetical protein
MEITWNISQLDRRTSDGFVTTAHWQASAVDGDFSASTYATCGWDGEPAVPYDSLTKEQVLEWVWQSVNKTEVESNLANQIDVQKNPVTATGVPW